MTAFKTGDHIMFCGTEFEITGPVHGGPDSTTRVTVAAVDGDPSNHYLYLRSKKVEKVAPEDYESGEMYADANGEYFMYYQFDRTPAYDGGCGWETPGDETLYAFDIPVRPLRKLVPEEGE